MNVEVGKTYRDRDGRKVTIESETDNELPRYRMQGVDHLGRITWCSRKGRFWKHPTRLDLVAEVTT
jgi:hypothetical protein